MKPYQSGGEFQLTAARRRLVKSLIGKLDNNPFQLTAARRRLERVDNRKVLTKEVSTHSRPKAAGPIKQRIILLICKFQLTAARRRLASEASD